MINKKALPRLNLRDFAVLLIPMLILVVGGLVHYWRGYYGAGIASIHAQGIDDSYITYRYGWNLAHSGILSWNESGYRRTEGFTNPLWVLLSVLWALPGHKEWVYPLSVVTSIVFSSILLVLLLQAVYTRYNRSGAAVAGLAMVAALPPIWLHLTSGLESLVFGLLLSLLTYVTIFLPDRWSRPSILLLTIITGLLRSDAFLYLGTVLAAALIAGSKQWKTIALGLLISSAALFTWRYLTFGTLLPNTAIAKVNFGLLERLPVGWEFLSVVLFNSGLAIFLLFGVAGLKLETRRAALAGLFVILAWMGYYLYVGGDAFLERHLVGIYFLSAAFSAPLWSGARHKTRLLLIGILVGVAIISIFRSGNRFIYFVPKGNDPWIMLGKAVGEHRDNYGVLITLAAGKIPFFAAGECIDAIGLNDPYLATFKREPFVPGHSSGNDAAATELARAHPLGVYARFSQIDPDFIKGPEDISLWVDNRSPQDEVQRSVTPEQWKAALDLGDPLAWSVITMPVQVAGEGP